MNKYELLEKLDLMLQCAENGIQIKAIEDISDDYKIYRGQYYVLSTGDVWSRFKNGFLTPFDNGQGYLYIKLVQNGVILNKRLNVLIAEAFVEKPEDWEPGWDAAHSDDNKYNNRADNLIWQPRVKNLDTEHWRKCNHHKIFAPVRCIETGEVFASQAAAGRAIGKHPYGINLCLMGKQKTCGGYHWERVLEDKEN